MTAKMKENQLKLDELKLLVHACILIDSDLDWVMGLIPEEEVLLKCRALWRNYQTKEAHKLVD